MIRVFAPNKPVPGQLLPQELGCWSHARDNFVDAMNSDAKSATEMIEMIAELYAVEKRAKKWTPEKRLALRQEESVLILDRIFTRCRESQLKYMPKEPMYAAITYCFNNRITSFSQGMGLLDCLRFKLVRRLIVQRLMNPNYRTSRCTR